VSATGERETRHGRAESEGRGGKKPLFRGKGKLRKKGKGRDGIRKGERMMPWEKKTSGPRSWAWP